MCLAPLTEPAEALCSQGASVYLVIDGRLAGLLAVSDPIKPGYPEAEALQILRASNIHVVMATGDGLTTAHGAGKQLDIDEVHGEVKVGPVRPPAVIISKVCWPSMYPHRDRQSLS